MRRSLLSRGGVAITACLLALAAGGVAVARAAFDPVYELKNFSKTTERFVYLTALPDYQLDLRVKNATRELQALQILASDRDRNFLGNLCWQRGDGCSGDVRLYDWVKNASGIALPVVFTARNGSNLSGHIWATAAGPDKRPGIVITNGSVQAPEELYWFVAQTLAKAGYVVLTWDPQGQGYSDTPGEGADQSDGVPSQSGRPFYDGTEDALDFFFSTPQQLYAPRRSCTTGTDHSPRQRDRYARGVSSGYNPLWSLLDTSRVGLAGHSLGAGAVSYVGQLDARVKAIVAWDNLSTGAPSFQGQAVACDSGSSPRPVPPITKPALGMSADYGLLPQPNTSEPNPLAKSTGSKAVSAAHVDTGEIVIRGGTHYEFSFIPNPGFGGTLRGTDLVAWYTLAWLDKYVKGGDATADARLVTNRWRADGRSAAIDLDKDGNMFSRYYRSRLDIGLGGGGRFLCEDMRAAACLLRPDGGPAMYDFLAVVKAKDGSGPGTAAAAGFTQSTDPAGADGVPPAANR